MNIKWSPYIQWVESKVEYQRFGDAQLEVYEQASFAWTLKKEKHSDFEWNFKHEYFESGKPNSFFSFFQVLCIIYHIKVSLVSFF